MYVLCDKTRQGTILFEMSCFTVVILFDTRFFLAPLKKCFYLLIHGNHTLLSTFFFFFCLNKGGLTRWCHDKAA